MNHRRAIRIRSLPWLVVLLLAAGCANQGWFQPHLQQQPPPFFTDSGTEQAPDRWWTAFDDPVLDYQINQALGSSYSLASARQRVSAARALARRESSDLVGDVNGVLGLSSTFRPGTDRVRMELGLEATHPIDWWGEIEARVQAERLRAESTNLDFYSVALTLSADIAGTWFSLIEAHAQVELLDDQIETNRKGLQSLELRFGSGLIRAPDVYRQRQLLESTLEQAVVAKARIEVLEHQLAVLLGEMPQLATYDPGTELPELPPLPLTGIPSELLQRRPDVRRDYMAFQAADRDLASAISAQYPRLDLTGSLLNITENPGTILRDWFLTIGEQLVAPLLDGGQRRAEVDRTRAVVCQLFYDYAQTVLTAFAEVEDSLTSEAYQLKRIERLENQAQLAGQASDQLRDQYQIGDVDFLDVLSAITSQQSLQRQLLSARLELVLIRVNLYRALAGDFDTRPQLVAPLLVDLQNEFDSDVNIEESDDVLDPPGSENTTEAKSAAESLMEPDGDE